MEMEMGMGIEMGWTYSSSIQVVGFSSTPTKRSHDTSVSLHHCVIRLSSSRKSTEGGSLISIPA